MRTIIAGVMLALSVTAAGAAEDMNSANYWMPFCRDHLRGQTTVERLDRSGQCAGTVAGLTYASPYLDRTYSCSAIPPQVTYEQAIRVVVRYIDRRPQRMHERFEALALEAISDAWPCKPAEAR